jgi:hypothetical protein
MVFEVVARALTVLRFSFEFWILVTANNRTGNLLQSLVVRIMPSLFAL